MMKCDEPTYTIMSMAIITIIMMYRLALGITQAIYLSKYNDYETECRLVWVQMCVMCVVNFLSVINGGINSQKEEKNHSFELISLGIGIWIQITWFNISSDCEDFWQDNANELWTLLIVEVVN